MKIHKEIAKILDLQNKITEQVKQLNEKIDVSGIDFSTAQLVELTDEQIKMYKDDLNNNYLVHQHNPYNDWYYGWLYFATKEKNKFIKVAFEC